MTDISATSFFRQAGLADSGGIDFEHEEIDTGGTKRPTKVHLHAVDPDSGDRMGTLTYHVPRRKADKILVEHLGTEDAHRGKGVASQLMDEMQRRHPATPIDHGDRTRAGKAWWDKYTDGKKVTRGRTMASRHTAVAAATKPCPCCGGTGEHDTGECYGATHESLAHSASLDRSVEDEDRSERGGLLGVAAVRHEERVRPSHGGRQDPLRAPAGLGLGERADTRGCAGGPHVPQPGSKLSGRFVMQAQALRESRTPGAGEQQREPREGARARVGNTLPAGSPVRRGEHVLASGQEVLPYLQGVDRASRVDGGHSKTASAERPEWADGDFTAKTGHTYHTVTEPKAVTMRTPEGSMAGYVNWGDDGVIGNMNVRDEHQRRGIATELLRRAREQRPDLQHSDRLSDDAQAWLKGIGERTAFTTPVPDNTQPYRHEHPWLPRDHFFAPGEKGLDPRLFDENERMHPIVRQHILGLLNGFWAPRYGDAWQTWARVYLAGSEASHFYGNGDLDVLIGVDYDTARAHAPALAAMSDDEISNHLTDELRHGLNDPERMLPGPDGKETGPWESTWYVNPDSYDIRDIKPYAAYDITRDEWAVDPVEVPDDFGPEKLPESTWDVFEALQKLIGAVRELPDGVREREGAALYDYLHADRHSAFGPEGSGLYDPANAVWKALDKAPDKPLQQLIDWKHAHDGVAAAMDQEKAA